MMPVNSAFSAGNVMTVSIEGLKEAQADLDRIAAGISGNGLKAKLSLATGMVHRYLIGLGRVDYEIGQPGVLPVKSGRLKNSMFWQVTGGGNNLLGRVTSNVAYAAKKEDMYGFMAKTVKDQEGPVNDLLSAEISRLITRKS
jgi:hypothetical protein